MQILFTNIGNGNHVLSCKRKDGSITWKHVSPFFIHHDLCHFAAEQSIPLKNAFFGMVNNGTNISDFELPKDQRSFQLTEEAIFAEHLVNLLTIELAQGKMENFLEILRISFHEHSATDLLTTVTATKLDEIRNRCEELKKMWDSLPENETLTLLFEV